MYKNRFLDNDKYKKLIDENRPLSQEALSDIKEYYKIGLTYSSNALEGNTLDLVETKVVIEDGITIGGKPIKDHLEALGHSVAYDKVLKLAQNDTITLDDIKKLHYLFFNKIDENQAGKYRDRQVVISGSDVEFPKPQELDNKMSEFVSKLPQMKKDLHPVEYATMVHVLFVNIHPFIDGNGRVARLLMNLALLQSGYNIVIIPPVVRGDYIAALTESNVGKYNSFINFISEMTLEAQKEYLKIIERF
ncbi:MAG: Fic family protein [Candidatus Gastranaerophilales bacterium]